MSTVLTAIDNAFTQIDAAVVELRKSAVPAADNAVNRCLEAKAQLQVVRDLARDSGHATMSVW